MTPTTTETLVDLMLAPALVGGVVLLIGLGYTVLIAASAADRAWEANKARVCDTVGTGIAVVQHYLETTSTKRGR